MALPNEVSCLLVMGLGLMLTGLLLHFIGLVTPAWSVTSIMNIKISFGLWDTCIDSVCETYEVTYYHSVRENTLKACRSLALTGMIIAIASELLAIYYQAMTISKKKADYVSLLPSSALAFTFILICAIIWGAKMHDPHTDALGYSFTLSLSGACLLPLGAFLMFLASKRVTGQVH